MIDAKTVFGFLADGSDETSKLIAAFAAGATAKDKLYFGPGTYGFNGGAPIAVLCDFCGCGIQGTTFKNLTASIRMFDFQPGGGGALGSAFMRGEDFTIDQNGSSGSAIRLNTQFNGLKNVYIKNHMGGIGGDYAVHAKNATLAEFENVHIGNSDSCLALEDCYYVCGRNVSLERQKGRALIAQNCAQIHFSGLYVDNGNPSSVGYSVPEVMLINGCTSFHVDGLSAELAPSGSLMANIPVPGEPNSKGYFIFRDSRNVNLNGVRINHTAPCTPAFHFYSDGGSLSLRGVEWYETTNSMILIGAGSANRRLSVDGVDTYNSASGSKYGVGMFYGMPARVTLKNWTDWDGVCSHYLKATDIFVEQCNAPVDLAGSGRRTLFNCNGGVSGNTSGAHLVNC